MLLCRAPYFTKLYLYLFTVYTYTYSTWPYRPVPRSTVYVPIHSSWACFPDCYQRGAGWLLFLNSSLVVSDYFLLFCFTGFQNYISYTFLTQFWDKIQPECQMQTFHKSQIYIHNTSMLHLFIKNVQLMNIVIEGSLFILMTTNRNNAHFDK